MRTLQTESMATTHAVMGVIRSVMPAFRNNNDKVAFVVHASFVVSGFILTATGRPAFASDALSSSTTESLVGIAGWNEFDEEYAFVYKSPVKGSKKNTVKRFLVKCLEMNGKLLVDAIAEDGKEFGHLQIEVGNYTDESREEKDYDAQFKNFGKLVTDLNSEILCKLNTISTTTKSSSEKNEEPRDYVGITSSSKKQKKIWDKNLRSANLQAYDKMRKAAQEEVRLMV